MKSGDGINITERDILRFAIEIEGVSAQFFANVGDPKARALLLDLADEERSHEAKLKKLIDNPELKNALIESYTEDDLEAIHDSEPKIPETEDSTVGEVMLYAMEQEKWAIDLYETFASLLHAGEFSDLCLHLAGEEREHLAEFEMLYKSARSE